MRGGAGRMRQFPATEIHAAEYLIGDGVTDNADVLEGLIADAVASKRQLILSRPPLEAGPYVGWKCSRRVPAPDDWEFLQIIGRGSGVCEVEDQSRAGCRLIFNGTDGIYIPLRSNKHEQLKLSGFAIHNQGGLGAVPTGYLIDIDEDRPFNYPNMWEFSDLSLAGFTNAGAFIRRPATKNIDQYGFFGRCVHRAVHTQRCENSLYMEGVFANLFAMEGCRHHSGGTLYWVSSGGMPKFHNCHWEDADRGVLRFAPYSYEFEAVFDSCETESCGTNIAIGGGLLHTDSWVQFDDGPQSRSISLIFTGHTRIPGAGEAPPTFDTRVRISNYSDNRITIDARGCHILTLATVDRQAGTVDDQLRWYTYPVTATGGAGSARTSVAQPLAGHRLFDQPAVPMAPTGAWPYIECLGSTVFSGQQIRRTPDCTAEKQEFVLSFVASMVANVSYAAEPGEIVLSGGSPLYWFPQPYRSQDAEVGVVIAFRCDQGGADARTLDGLAIAPTGVTGRRSLGYGSWHPVTETVVHGRKQASATSALVTSHPAGYRLPYLANVPAGGSHTIAVRASPDKPVAMKIEARTDTATAAQAQFAFSGRTGAAATKDQDTIHTRAPGASNITFTAQDGADADMGQLVVANAGGAACLVRADIQL